MRVSVQAQIMFWPCEEVIYQMVKVVVGIN